MGKKEIANYTQNRELSWLRFNERVLEEARDESVPLMERMKFVAIFTSNLDEFFMIRVGSLCDMAAAKIQLLETEEAMELLLEAEKTAPTQRGTRMRSLLLMEAGREKELPESLTDEEKKRLSEERAEARKRALETPGYREVKDAFLQDPVKRQKACGELLKKWKKEYRRMS